MSGPPQKPDPATAAWRQRLHEIIFEADTPAGKTFDVALLVVVLLSVLVVMLESVKPPDGERGDYIPHLRAAEWTITILFTIEYVLRLICVRKPLRFALSFYGIIDFLAIAPGYLSLAVTGAQSLLVIRALRLLRIFRIFKLAQFEGEATALRRAMWASREKVVVFLSTVLVIVTIMGTAMYIIEGGQERAGFTSIPQSVYWAVVTTTTVGYGDIAPTSTPGKALAAVIMIIGYSLIIIPTGIFAAELARGRAKPLTTQVCPDCSREGHDPDAVHCKFCGGKL